MAPQPYLTTADSRRLDALAVERFGIPSVVLMENAARNAAGEILSRFPGARHAVIFCGPGNNGGDGMALARHLHNARIKAECVLAAEPKTDDARTNWSIVRAMGLPLLAPGDPVEPRGDTLLIDALLGTGAAPPLRPPIDALVAQINEMRSAALGVVALDIPTGLDTDAEPPEGALAVRADLTIAFAALKPVHLCAGAQPCLGESVVVPIGAPRELVESLLSIAEDGQHPGDDASSARLRPQPPIPGRTVDAPPAAREHEHREERR